MIQLHERRRPGGRALGGLRRAAVAGTAVTALVGGLLVPVAAGGTASADAVVTSAPPATAALPAVLQDVPAVGAFDTELVRLINVARGRAGLAPLQEARGLDRLAGWWSGQLAAGTGTLAHNPDGLAMVTGHGAATRTVWAENVAKLTPSATITAQGLLDVYLASPTHQANLLNPKFGYVGIGTVSTAAGVGFNTLNFTDAVDAGQAYDPRAAVTPVGQFEALTLTGATVRVAGWAVEPGLDGPPRVTVTDTAPGGTVVVTTTTAGVARPGVPDVYPTSATHAFDTSFTTGGRGAHTVCATVTDTGVGLGDVALGCLGYTVGDPVGAFDTATVSGRTATVRGWAVDPDQPTTPATVTVSDRLGTGPVTTTRIVAGAVNAGVDTAVPGAGSAHGFSTQFPVSGVGEHTLCASVEGVRATVRVDLGCKTVTVAASAPVGGFQSAVSADRRTVDVTGWAADPDQPTTASTVEVAVTSSAGTTRSTMTAGRVATTTLPAGLGQTHGFAGTVPLTATGTNRVCVTAVSRGSAAVTTDLGCRDVAVTWLHGWLDSVTPAVSGGARTLAVRGWAIDQGSPTSAAPVTLTVTGPNGRTSSVVPAGALRADVGRAFAGTGNNHGYVTTVPVARSGTYTVCASVAGVKTPAQLVQLRCVPVTVG